MFGAKEQALREYRRRRIETAQPGQLIIMLYDGIVASLGSARRALVPGDGQQKTPGVAGEQLTRAQRLLQELQFSVDPSVELGPMLLDLYGVLMHQLVQANVSKDLELIAELEQQFVGLRETWAQVVMPGMATIEAESTLEESQ